MLFKFAMNIYLKKLQNIIFPRNINVPMSWCGPNHIVDFLKLVITLTYYLDPVLLPCLFIHYELEKVPGGGGKVGMKIQEMRILKNVFIKRNLVKEKKIIQAFENPCLYLAHPGSLFSS